MSSSFWQVVGGGDKGGILVREGQDTKSAELPDRLATGSVVKELSLVGDRLQYQSITGAGPQTGWVSLKLKGKDLLVKQDIPEISLAPPPNVWRVVYYQSPTRGEQLRLLFRWTETPFDNVKLVDYPASADPYRSTFIGDKSPLPFDQTPVVQYNGITIAQVAAGMQFVGEKLGLVDDNPEARAKAIMWTLGSEEMRDKLFYPCFNAVNGHISRCMSEGVSNEDMLRQMNDMVPTFCDDYPYDRWMSHFERHFRTAGTDFLLGGEACYADISLYDCVSAIWGVPICERMAERKRKYPLLLGFVKRVRALPKIKEYIDERGEFWQAITKQAQGEQLP